MHENMGCGTYKWRVAERVDAWIKGTEELNRLLTMDLEDATSDEEEMWGFATGDGGLKMACSDAAFSTHHRLRKFRGICIKMFYSERKDEGKGAVPYGAAIAQDYEYIERDGDCYLED